MKSQHLPERNTLSVEDWRHKPIPHQHQHKRFERTYKQAYREGKRQFCWRIHVWEPPWRVLYQQPCETTSTATEAAKRNDLKLEAFAPCPFRAHFPPKPANVLQRAPKTKPAFSAGYVAGIGLARMIAFDPESSASANSATGTASGKTRLLNSACGSPGCQRISKSGTSCRSHYRAAPVFPQTRRIFHGGRRAGEGKQNAASRKRISCPSN